MKMTTTEILIKGMQCLVENLGIVEAEQFVSAVKREKFDYTKWQRLYFDEIPVHQLHKEAVEYGRLHPFQGDAEIISE